MHSNHDAPDVMKSAIDKNDALIQFFFKSLYIADKQPEPGYILIKDLEEKDLEMARDTFEYLTMMLPFL